VAETQTDFGRSTTGCCDGSSDEEPECARTRNDDENKTKQKKKSYEKKSVVTFRIGRDSATGRHITRLVRKQTSMFFNEIARDLARTTQNSSGKVHGRRAIKVTRACKSQIARRSSAAAVIIYYYHISYCAYI